MVMLLNIRNAINTYEHLYTPEGVGGVANHCDTHVDHLDHLQAVRLRLVTEVLSTQTLLLTTQSFWPSI